MYNLKTFPLVNLLVSRVNYGGDSAGTRVMKRKKKRFDYQPASIRRHAAIAARHDANTLKKEIAKGSMKRLIPILAIFWLWASNPFYPAAISPQPVCYFEQTQSVAKPVEHGSAWFDGTGWRGVDAR